MIGDITDRLRKAAVSTDDKELYAIAAEEVHNKLVDPGLYAKAFADSDGDESKARALYLRMRVKELTQMRDAIITEMKAVAQQESNKAQAVVQQEPDQKPVRPNGQLWQIIFGLIGIAVGIWAFMPHSKDGNGAASILFVIPAAIGWGLGGFIDKLRNKP